MSFSEGITFEDGIEEPAPHCWQCSTTLVYGEEVERGGRSLCRDCAHEAREEEATKC
jgi:hypothetical protein